MSPKVPCPNCGKRFEGVAVHWAKSSTCGYPSLTDRQRDILEGLLLSGAGGFIRRQKGAEYTFVLHSTNKGFLEWLRNQFGVIGKPIREAATADETASELAKLREASGEDTTVEYNTETLYRFESRTLPEFGRVHARWTNTDGETYIPAGFTPSPLTLAVVYVMRGYLETLDTSQARAVAFYRGGRAIGTDEEWMAVFAPYSPVLWGQEERLVLRDTETFVTTLESVDDLPLATLPHDPREESVLATTDEDDVQCPSCGSYFTDLKRHWATTDCAPTGTTSDDG